MFLWQQLTTSDENADLARFSAHMHWISLIRLAAKMSGDLLLGTNANHLLRPCHSSEQTNHLNIRSFPLCFPRSNLTESLEDLDELVILELFG